MAEYPAVRTVFAPYDSGHRGVRMGAGPGHLRNNGLPRVLRSENRPSSTFVDVVAEADPPAEVAVAFELDRLVSEQVREAVAGGQFPLVLSGNCNTCVGTISGAGPRDLGVVWFDAHGEFNTPETTTSGFLDGMGLAIAVGRCWKAMAAGVPGFRPLPEENVAMAGVRDTDPAERERLGASGVALVGADGIGARGPRALAGALDDLRTRVGRVYVHLDLDVLDPREAQANGFPAPGGPGVDRLVAAVRLLGERLPLGAACISAYDPAYDAEGKTLRAALRLAATLAATAGK
jgi:arginase